MWGFLIFVVLVAQTGALVGCLLKLADQKKRLSRYARIDDVERHREALEKKNARTTRELSALDELILKKSRQADELDVRIRALEEMGEDQEFGFYERHYDFEHSDQYKARLDSVVQSQKELIKSQRAARFPTDWVLDGSRTKGAKAIKEHVKLLMRAFNGECDAAIAKVKYNNATTLEKRISASFEALNKLGASRNISITERYRDLKLQELSLVHEYREQLQAEKEEQRRIKEEMREEEKALREAEKARLAAEKEEQQYQKALDKARAELSAASGDKLAELQALTRELEDKLKLALETKAKAISQAQLTKSGHVYVISNIGSFGEGVYKIGMTRRLNPDDRVRELSGASVPFMFDVHAMIHSENAPALENALHKEFDHRRVNRINTRKEFFRVSLTEIKEAAERLHGRVTIVPVPHAEEFRKTRALEREEKARLSKSPSAPSDAAAPPQGSRLVSADRSSSSVRY